MPINNDTILVTEQNNADFFARGGGCQGEFKQIGSKALSSSRWHRRTILLYLFSVAMYFVPIWAEIMQPFYLTFLLFFAIHLIRSRNQVLMTLDEVRYVLSQSGLFIRLRPSDSMSMFTDWALPWQHIHSISIYKPGMHMPTFLQLPALRSMNHRIHIQIFAQCEGKRKRIDCFLPPEQLDAFIRTLHHGYTLMPRKGLLTMQYKNQRFEPKNDSTESLPEAFQMASSGVYAPPASKQLPSDFWTVSTPTRDFKEVLQVLDQWEQNAGIEEL